MRFENNYIPWEQLPSVEDAEFFRLSKNYRTFSLLRASFAFLFYAIITLLVVIFVQLWTFTYILSAAIVLFLLLVFLLVRAWKLYEFMGYALREHDIIYKSGWLWKRQITVPFNRIQHVEIRRGPLEELLELRKLEIFTAGGSSSDLSIAGLEPDQAERLRNFIALKTGMDEEE